MQTIEEAGEEFLSGKPYIECGQCHGTTKVSEWQGSCCYEVDCRHCEKGWVPRPEYLAACKALDRPMPTLQQALARKVSVDINYKLSM